MQVLSVITALLANEKAPGLEQLGQTGHYDEDYRERIVVLAEQFLKSGAKFRGAEAMTVEPQAR